MKDYQVRFKAKDGTLLQAAKDAARAEGVKLYTWLADAIRAKLEGGKGCSR